MKDAQKAGLIVNWIGCQCIMTLHSMGVQLDKPQTVFENLEKIFHPESNQTLSRFKFHSIKQKFWTKFAIHTCLSLDCPL